MYCACGNAIPLLGNASCRIYRFVREELNVPFLREFNLRTPEESFLVFTANTHPSYSRTPSDRVSEQITEEHDDVETPVIGDYITLIYRTLRKEVLYEIAMDCLHDPLSTTRDRNDSSP